MPSKTIPRIGLLAVDKFVVRQVPLLDAAFHTASCLLALLKVSVFVVDEPLNGTSRTFSA